jgi:uncharacterized protein (UPF0332 family)
MGKSESDSKKTITKDLELIFFAIKEMMLTYGFSAKRNTGFGIAKDELEIVSCDMKGIEKKIKKQKPSQKKSCKPKKMKLHEFQIQKESIRKSFCNTETFLDLIKAFQSIIDSLQKQ